MPGCWGPPSSPLWCPPSPSPSWERRGKRWEAWLARGRPDSPPQRSWNGQLRCGGESGRPPFFFGPCTFLGFPEAGCWLLGGRPEAVRFFFSGAVFFFKKTKTFWTRTSIRSGQVEHCEPLRLIYFMFVVFGVWWADVLGVPLHVGARWNVPQTQTHAGTPAGEAQKPGGPKPALGGDRRGRGRGA